MKGSVSTRDVITICAHAVYISDTARVSVHVLWDLSKTFANTWPKTTVHRLVKPTVELAKFAI